MDGLIVAALAGARQREQSMLRRITAVLAIVTAIGGTTAVRADATTPTYREYVALGDSWSADVFTTFPPTTQYAPLDCAQSSTDYPHQIAALLHIRTFRDATCGSATTVEMTQPQSLPLGGTNPPQFSRLTATTDLVTLGIGGNDIGLAGDITSCLNLLPAPLGTSCKTTFTAGGDQISKAVAATAPKIARVLQQIRSRAPHARILLVNYLNGIPANGIGCWPVVPIWNVDVAYLQAKFLQMNAMLATVAGANHVQLVDSYSPSV